MASGGSASSIPKEFPWVASYLNRVKSASAALPGIRTGLDIARALFGRQVLDDKAHAGGCVLSGSVALSTVAVSP